MIHEDGSPAETTQRLPRLRFVLFGEAPDREGDGWLAQAAPQQLPAALTAANRILPVARHDTIPMRLPVAPERKSLWRPAPGPIPNPFVPFGHSFFAEWLGRFSRNSKRWRQMIRRGEVRWDQIDAKVDAAITRVKAKRVEFDANWGETQTRLAKLAAQRPSERPTTEMAGLVADVRALVAAEGVAR